MWNRREQPAYEKRSPNAALAVALAVCSCQLTKKTLAFSIMIETAFSKHTQELMFLRYGMLPHSVVWERGASGEPPRSIRQRGRTCKCPPPQLGTALKACLDKDSPAKAARLASAAKTFYHGTACVRAQTQILPANAASAITRATNVGPATQTLYDIPSFRLVQFTHREFFCNREVRSHI